MLSENLCHPRHHKRGDRVSGGVERSETVLESSSLPAVRTGEGLLVYRVGERRQFVQEKGLWCTEWGKRQQFVQEKAFWCTNRVNSGAIAPQRDGGGRDVA